MKILITGGSGTIGKAFIKRHNKGNEFFVVGRNERLQTELIREFPNVKNKIGSIEDKSFLFRIFDDFRPDVVVHAAAMKHVNLAETNPVQACQVNVMGSLNVIEASVRSNVPITISISTDKACAPENVYGYTKSLMESCFLDANTDTNKFAVCRFANVTHSNGSVLPFWLDLKSKGEPLKLTDPNMNRLMFSKNDSADLVMESIKLCNYGDGGFVLSKIMKSVNMLDLAKSISDDIVITGKRPGEKVNETLINKDEVPFTYVRDDGYIMIKKEKNEYGNSIEHYYSSETAEKMNEKEIEILIGDK